MHLCADVCIVLEGRIQAIKQDLENAPVLMVGTIFIYACFCGSNQVILGRDLRSNTDSVWSFYREKYLEIASGPTIFGASNDNS